MRPEISRRFVHPAHNVVYYNIGKYIIQCGAYIIHFVERGNGISGKIPYLFSTNKRFKVIIMGALKEPLAPKFKILVTSIVYTIIIIHYLNDSNYHVLKS